MKWEMYHKEIAARQRNKQVKKQGKKRGDKGCSATNPVKHRGG